MNITHGLLHGQVLQRDKRNMGTATVTGECAYDGVVEAQVRNADNNRIVYAWKKAGDAAKGRWCCQLPAVPAGGPYGLSLRIRRGSQTRETVDVKEFFVGDVWFMAGQSNMQGAGLLSAAPRPHPLVRCFYMTDEWRLAREPLHELLIAVDECHWAPFSPDGRRDEKQARDMQRRMTRGVCPGMFFGIEMVERTGVPQGLVACAHGGTALSMWSPKYRSRCGESFYGAMLRRYTKLGQPIAGMLWYQGCSEAPSPFHYTTDMKRLVAATRRDFRLPGLPWIVAQIGRFVDGHATPVAWNMIQEQQRRLPDVIENLDVVPTADLELDDWIHVASDGHARLGVRMARVVDRLAMGNRSEKGGLQPVARITMTEKEFRDGGKTLVVTVRIANVDGGLRSAGRPSGFGLVNAAGEKKDAFYRINLEDNKAVMESVLPIAEIRKMYLCYGYGLNPYLNITDARDMALPIFNTAPFPKERKTQDNGTQYMTRWEMAELGVVPSGVAAVRYPGTRADLAWMSAPRGLCIGLETLVMPARVTERRHGVYVFRAAVSAAKTAVVMLSLGSDSGIKVWLNGRQAYLNENATNPCVPDMYQTKIVLNKGPNEFTVAFDSRDGRGWGFTMRFKPLSPGRELPNDLITIA